MAIIIGGLRIIKIRVVCESIVYYCYRKTQTNWPVEFYYIIYYISRVSLLFSQSPVRARAFLITGMQGFSFF